MCIDPDCIEITRVTLIKVHENGKKVVIRNPKQIDHLKVQVDKCLCKNQRAADWIISKPAVGDLIIELKGANLSDAFEQITATAQYWINNNHAKGRLAALIVTSHMPRNNTKIQRAKNKFISKFKVPLHVQTRNQEYEFERILEYNGPR